MLTGLAGLPTPASAVGRVSTPVGSPAPDASPQAAGAADSEPAQGAVPSPDADTSAAGEAAGAAATGAAVERFDVWEYRVAGNDKLDRKVVERTVYRFLGPGRSIDEIEQARAALETAYRDAGYATVLVNIPEQDVVGGVVRLEVVEGKVSRLRITGSRYFSLGRIRAKVPGVAEGEVPYLPEVQKQLASLNQATPDRLITPVLRPGRTPGTVEVELKVDDKLPLHGSLEMNDQYTRDTTRTRLNASLRYDNLWQREHSVGLSYQVAPQERDEVEVISGTYLFRPEGSSWLGVLYGVGSNSDVATVGTLGVVGQGTIIGARAVRPLTAPSTGYFHSVTLGFDYKDFSESIALQGSDTLNTPISYHRLSVAYSGTFTGGNARTTIGAEVAGGLRGLGNGEREFEDKRFRAEPNYLYLRFNAERTQPAPFNSTLYLRMAGQVAAAPLISNEQFNAGGADSVRGYLESQALADDGLSGTVEWRSASFAQQVWSGFTDLRGHLFADGARLRVQRPLPGQTGEFSLLSAGIGFTATLYESFRATLDWAFAFEKNRPIAAGDSRVHFSVGYDF